MTSAIYCFNKVCDQLIPKIRNHTSDDCLEIDIETLKKVNRIFHLCGKTNLSIQHQVIAKIEKMPNVSIVYYDIVANEEFMDFSKIQIIFKKNS